MNSPKVGAGNAKTVLTGESFFQAKQKRLQTFRNYIFKEKKKKQIRKMRPRKIKRFI